MNQPTTPPLTTFKPGEKITGTAMLGEHKGQPVTGEYLAPFGAAKHRALNILTEDGTRIPVEADTAELAVPLAVSFLIQYLTSARATTPKYYAIEAPSASEAVEKFLDLSTSTIVQDVFPAPLPREEWRG